MSKLTLTLTPGMRLASICTTACAALLLAGAVQAQGAYPNKPIRIVVPFPPGGGIDVAARVVGQMLSESLGQPVVIDNRAGAGGVIGSDAVAKSPPDGYTLLACTPGPTSISPSTYARLPYNPLTDFAPVSMLALGANILVVNPDSPVKSVQDLIALARSKPGGLNFGSSGIGTSQHLSGEMFKSLAKIDAVHVAYKGTGLALADIIGGRIDFMFADPGVLTQVKAGKLRALAATTSKRYASAPELPTVAESGLPGFDATNWYCLLAPAGTPKDIVTRLNTEVVKILKNPEVRDKLMAQNIEATSSTPEYLGQYMRDDVAKWAGVVKAAGVKPE